MDNERNIRKDKIFYFFTKQLSNDTFLITKNPKQLVLGFSKL